MTSFLSDQFLLCRPTAERLYHEYAEKIPIYDYHCHLDPGEIWNNSSFSNMTELWLKRDHYKWRLMRASGIPEAYITGNAEDQEKFQAFAEILPRAAGNPVYHWCHMELKKYFGYEGNLNRKTAEEVWNMTRDKLKCPEFRPRDLMLRSNVAMIGTTDDPCDSLKYHGLLRASEFPVQVCPSFRPDAILHIESPIFTDRIRELEKETKQQISDMSDLAEALSQRMEWFRLSGCKTADHGLFRIGNRMAQEKSLNQIFRKAMTGQPVTPEESEAYQTAVLLYCGREYARLGWVMQIHFSCVRNPNSLALKQYGPDSGYDCIGVTENCRGLIRLMDRLEQESSLPKMILYSLNPEDNSWIDTLAGSFPGCTGSGKIQHGAAWWFNDHKAGIQRQLVGMASRGVLGNFVGMLTDSRSFLSYVRHEYFRRILCNLVGEWMEQGEYPDDMEMAGALVEDICGNNIKRFLRLE